MKSDDHKLIPPLEATYVTMILGSIGIINSCYYKAVGSSTMSDKGTTVVRTYCPMSRDFTVHGNVK